MGAFVDGDGLKGLQIPGLNVAVTASGEDQVVGLINRNRSNAKVVRLERVDAGAVTDVEAFYGVS